MKKLTKILVFVLAMIFATSAIACNRDSDGVDIDHTRSQLYVSIYDGGYGTEWAYKLAERFENHYKNVSFENDKQGVQVIIVPQKASGTGLMNNILASRNEVFFSPEAYFNDYYNAGVFADITDIVSGADSDLSEYGDSGNIEDKFLNDAQKEFYKSKGNKYYAIPSEMCFFGVTYDVELFDNEGYYFAKNKNNGNDGFIISATDERSYGPDGKTGEINGVDYSLDDGLPATYEEFFKLCNYIVEGGNVPFIWSGQYRMGYIGAFLQALMADYEGAEQMLLNYTFEGVANNIISGFDANDNPIIKDPVNITVANGNEMFSTAGRYYALKFIEQMVSDPAYYDSKSFNVTHTHTDAQLDYLMSVTESKQIAMFIDGGYWEAEATDDFEDMASRLQDESYKKQNRKFGFMPFPKATEDKVGEKNTLIEGLYCLAYIRGNLSGWKLDLAKKFLKFAHTNVSLVEYTVVTSTRKALKTTYTDADYAKMSNYGRSLTKLTERSDVVFPISTKSIYLANQKTFNNKYNFQATIKGATYNDPIDVFRPAQVNHKTAIEFFQGIAPRYESWAIDYKDFINNAN